MRVIYVAVAVSVFALAAGCTKKNPNLCCTDAADCEAQGLPDDAQCGDGLVCRGNQCIAETCSTAADCDAAAPYCLLDQGRCAEACTVDAQCPGFGQDTSDTFCVGGSCVACREGMNDCSAEAPICDAGSCRTCVENVECASGVCDHDGTCVAESAIAFVAPTGSDVSDCSRLSPCSLSHALAGAQTFVELSSGDYTTAVGFQVAGTRRVVGAGSARPRITRSTAGPVFSLSLNTDASFEHLEVFGATGTIDDDVAIDCPTIPSASSRIIRLDDDFLHDNAYAAVLSQTCTLFASRTTIANNGVFGMKLTDTNGTIDRCIVTGNHGDGLNLDSGLYAVTNTFITRNDAAGLNMFLFTGASHFDFNTIVDNGTLGITAMTNGNPLQIANSIIARNGTPMCDGCVVLGSLILFDVSSLHFASPDVAPFDYHLTAGSIAIDTANPAVAADHDIDGDARPSGTAMDVGADEAH